ncbi:hypothetical protein, partial [Stenotrophomonas maltophilia]|uniref:hypothetical protein n=1 Tax=Stenotrophomonas maltophilia TaxID=40324 RepID=UPI0019532945
MKQPWRAASFRSSQRYLRAEKQKAAAGATAFACPDSCAAGGDQPMVGIENSAPSLMPEGQRE